MSDDDLIRDYVRERSAAAFATLVERHLNLVYSVARRHVRSAALAEEVAQAVFVDLARDASRLKPDTPLVAWLHLVARRTAIDVVRGEARRHVREQAAAQLAETMNTPEPAWTEVEPVLDEAVEALNAADRAAILLRYFENKSLREVGAALGTSEDAAQKRVSRAIDQLRAFFLQRGVAVSAAGLAAALSTHAIVTAPAGLGAAISSASAIAATTTAEVTRTLAMTTLQKSLVAASLVLVVGAGIHEATLHARQESALATLEQRAAGLAAQLRQAREQNASTTAQLKSVEDEIDARLPKPIGPTTPADAALEAQARTWLGTIDQLHRLANSRPELRLPETALLTDDAWFAAATFAQLDSDEGIRRTFSRIRQIVDNQVVSKLGLALSAYLKDSAGVLPERIEQLAPFLDPTVDARLLERFEMLRTGKVADIPNAQRMELIGTKAPFDVEYDQLLRIGITGGSSTTAMNANVSDARRAFTAANPGRQATTAAELTPFLKWPVDPVALQKYLSRTGTPR